MIETRTINYNGDARVEVTDPEGDVVYVEPSYASDYVAFVAALSDDEIRAPGAWLTADEADVFADRLKALAAQWRARQ